MLFLLLPLSQVSCPSQQDRKGTPKVQQVLHCFATWRPGMALFIKFRKITTNSQLQQLSGQATRTTLGTSLVSVCSRASISIQLCQCEWQCCPRPELVERPSSALSRAKMLFDRFIFFYLYFYFIFGSFRRVLHMKCSL